MRATSSTTPTLPYSFENLPATYLIEPMDLNPLQLTDSEVMELAFEGTMDLPLSSFAAKSRIDASLRSTLEQLATRYGTRTFNATAAEVMSRASVIDSLNEQLEAVTAQS